MIYLFRGVVGPVMAQRVEKSGLLVKTGTDFSLNP
jgi:hypothetical protein